MAFTRKSGNEEYLIVASLNRNNLEGYNMPLPPEAVEGSAEQ